MPKIRSRITAALTLILLLTFLPPVCRAAEPGSFPDTGGHWAETEIRFLAQKGVVGGYPDGNFFPAKHISRRELAKIVFALFPAGAYPAGKQPGTYPDYPDIHRGWGREYLRTAINYLPGFTDGYFKPDAPATRYEVAWLALASSLVQNGHYQWEGDKPLLKVPLPGEDAWRQTVHFKEYSDLPERYSKSTAYLPRDPDKKNF
ncbi:MAG: S-layer homology domain-containing protein, partial [Firmicutes bacterium]|nr:S-layer homology domain-containing protein [Bacillota bacterium]